MQRTLFTHLLSVSLSFFLKNLYHFILCQLFLIYSIMLFHSRTMSLSFYGILLICLLFFFFFFSFFLVISSLELSKPLVFLFSPLHYFSWAAGGVGRQPLSLSWMKLWATDTEFKSRHTKTEHSTAQHSTAQHSTAQHSTAQHSTAQVRTDRFQNKKKKEEDCRWASDSFDWAPSDLLFHI